MSVGYVLNVVWKAYPCKLLVPSWGGMSKRFENGLQHLIRKGNHPFIGFLRLVKKKMTDEMIDQLKFDLAHPPSTFGYEQGSWTLPLIQQYIKRTFGVEYSHNRLCELLHAWKFSVKKPRHKSKRSNPEVQKRFLEVEFPQLILNAQKEAQERGLKFETWFPDEAGIRRIGTLHGAWYPTGNYTPEVLDTDGRFESIKLMGMVNPLSGAFALKIIPGKITTKVYAQFLIDFARRKNDTLLVIVHDNAPWHGKIKLPLLLKEAGIENIILCPLPSYSPELNPCEKLWKWLRERVTHNRPCHSLSDLALSVWKFYRYIYNRREEAKRRFKTEQNIFAFCESV